MNQMMRNINKSVQNIKKWVIGDLIKQQKPQLDKQIDEMLKPPRIIQKVKNLGISIGRKINFRGLGKKIGGLLN